MFLPAAADMVFEDEGALSRAVIRPVDGISKYTSGMLNSVVAKDCSRHKLTEYPRDRTSGVKGDRMFAYTNAGISGETWSVSQRLDVPLLWARQISSSGALYISGPSSMEAARYPDDVVLSNREYAVGLVSVSAPWQSVPDLSGLPDLEDASFRYASSLSVGAFKNCPKLVSVGLHGALAAESAFEGCSSLLSFPDVVGVARNMFKGCSSLVFPELDLSDLSTIPEGCFDGCSNLTSVVLYRGAVKSDGTYDLAPGSGLSTDKPRLARGSIGARSFAGTGITSLLIPCDVVGWGKTSWTPSIDSTAFDGCGSLSSVEFHIGSSGSGDSYWVNTSARFLPYTLYLKGDHMGNNYNGIQAYLPTVSSGVESSMFGLPDSCVCRAGRYDLSTEGSSDYADLVSTVGEIKGS